MRVLYSQSVVEPQGRGRVVVLGEEGLFASVARKILASEIYFGVLGQKFAESITRSDFYRFESYSCQYNLLSIFLIIGINCFKVGGGT
jgi:hypothetical protein